MPLFMLLFSRRSDADHFPITHLPAAQESGQTYITDTEEARTIPSVIVSTASPQLTSQELESNTPISGWVEANHSESATPKPAERVVQSTESAHRLAEISAGKQAGSDLTEIVHDIDSLNVAKKPRKHVHGRGHHTFEESSIDTAFTGDGEDLNDTLGRPKSPEELIRLRQSRERVVLGSQGANTRAGQAAPIRRARAASMAKELHQKNVSPPSKTEDIASSEQRPMTTLQRSASSSKALVDSRSTRINSGDNEPAPSPHTGRKEASEELKSPKSGMRMRRPLGFLSKRRDISESSVDSTHSHSRSASLNVVDSLPDLKKENVPFWRLGIGRDKRNVSSQETNKNKGPEKEVKESKEGEPREVAAKTEQESIPSLGRKSAQKGTHLCLSDDKAHKSYRLGALKGEVKPRRIRVRHRNKPTKEREFSNLYLVQELHLGGRAAANANAGSSPSASPLLKPQKALASTSQTSLTGSDSGQNVANGKRKATWVMKFSLDGKYLAVAGQDAVIRVFGVLDSPIARSSALQLTKDVNPSELLPGSPRTRDTDLSVSEEFNMSKNKTESEAEVDQSKDWSHEVDSGLVFTPDPIKEFKGHTSDILDLSWSKGGFLLSASMDKTARVWHLSWPNNLVAFVHGDFVTSAVFHPRDDRFFLSGSLDGKLRLWNISTKKVQASQEVPGLITACAFTHSGNTACVGTFSGAALFYQTVGLVFTSSVAVRSASGKHQKGGRKITAIEPILTEEAFSAISNFDGKEEQQSSLQNSSERVLITSNDSRVRAFDIGSKSMIVRYKAKTYTNRSSQIRATLTDDNTFILTGSEATSSSEGGQVHIWSSAANLFDISQKGLLSKLASGGMNAVAAANQKTTSLLRSGSRKGNSEKTKTRPSTAKEERKVQKQKDRSDVILDDTVEYFTAHAGTVTCAIIAPALSNGHLRKANDPLLSMSEEKIQQRLVGNSTGDNEGLAQFGRTISAAMTSPLRIASGGPQTFSTATSTASSSAITQSIGLSNKVNRIIVTVDDQAIVRVWRNDSLAVLSPSNGKGK
jgi:WD40 repeat protein